MDKNKYRITLLDEGIKKTYIVWAFDETEAIILAQAMAINNGKGYKFVSIEQLKLTTK